MKLYLLMWNNCKSYELERDEIQGVYASKEEAESDFLLMKEQNIKWNEYEDRMYAMDPKELILVDIEDKEKYRCKDNDIHICYIKELGLSSLLTGEESPYHII